MRHIEREDYTIISYIIVRRIGWRRDIVNHILVRTYVSFSLTSDIFAQMSHCQRIQVNRPVRPNTATIVEDSGVTGLHSHRSSFRICRHGYAVIVGAVRCISQV